MIDLFYRRPPSTYSKKSLDSSFSCEDGLCLQSEGIPLNLSFERVINGHTSAPCTIDEFNKYLRFSNMSEHADALQFYVWVRGYTKRFDTDLSSTEKALSPPCAPTLRPTGLPAQSASQTSLQDAPSNSSSNTDLPNMTFGKDVVLEPFTIQPFRAEIDRISSLYLTPNSPLTLPLSPAEKATTLDCLRRTTHPTAFSSAMISLEYSLRTTAHPSFIRYSLSNATRTRLSFISVVGFVLIILSIFTLIILTLSHVSRWYRLLTFFFLFPGLNMIANARRGLCLLLVVLGMARNLSPWEVYAVEDRESLDLRRSATMSDQQSRDGKDAIEVNVLDLSGEMDRKHNEEETRVRWFVKEYDNRPVLSRVFERRVPVRDTEVRRLQLSMITQNAAIASGLAAIVEIIFIALPQGHFF
ncbi:hypothetical protein TWF694_000285 [Orbilia ellipsospora]|uniref:RGS domain-containing protein n=1 Tax=Orbilia ellipsospora TaxID=2528407 RepID=A0AAV9XP17_9PEZI